jgi:hypothetical protein
MAHDLLARLSATKVAAERELELHAERVDTARLERAIADLKDVTDSARDLARLIAAHRENEIAIRVTGGNYEAQLRHSAEALQEAGGLDGEHAGVLATDTERVFKAAELELQAALRTSRANWLQRQPRPNQAFTTVFRDLAPSEMDGTESALADVDELARDEIDTPEMLERLARAVKVLNDNYERLTEKAPEIVRFFLERAPVGVALSELSDEVVNWLRDNQADYAFTIVLRAQ